ncbi:MAG: serine/threonine protein kinase [Chloroflexaceae bacterium]|nr:serine/threonine protein kinase [Chloroflexaceae bacterium]
MSEDAFNFQSTLEVINTKLVEQQARPLTDSEISILRGVWEDKTYTQIAEENDYRPNYITNVFAPELLHRLSDLIGQTVRKKNCRQLLENYARRQGFSSPAPVLLAPTPLPATGPSEYQPVSAVGRYPTGAVPLDSRFYIERSPVEQQIYQEIKKPGALVRIRAPKEMGKSSLLLRLLNYAQEQDYRTINLNLAQIDSDIISDQTRFLRWLCATVSRLLQLEPKLDDYWDEDIGSKVSCTLYFRGFILSQIDRPLVLALDEVNQLFEHTAVAKDVLPLLRSWYEEAKRSQLWQKLRLVVVHSTEIYVPLQITQSPFNVGLPILLEGFNKTQVQELAKRYGLDWLGDQEVNQLIELVGGHPALIHLALYHLGLGDITLEELLQSASNPVYGIYRNHLQAHCTTLKAQGELASALQKVMDAVEPIRLEPIATYKLSSMGLVKQVENKVSPSCNLYRQVFSTPKTDKNTAVRVRGVVLTHKGLEKLRQAKSDLEWAENGGRRFTLEELSERTTLAVDTIMKVLAAEVKVDKNTLKIFLRTFNLTLEAGDYYCPAKEGGLGSSYASEDGE